MASRRVLGLARVARAAPRVTPCIASSSRFVSTAVESSAAPPLIATKEKKTFDFPPLKRVPQTHGVHVATLHMRAYFPYNLDLFSQFAVRAAANLNMPTSGIASLPTMKELVTVPKSPFVHKKSQENFARYTHKRVIKIFDTQPEVLDLYLRYLKKNSIGGVGIKAYIHEFEEFGFGSKDFEPLVSLKTDEVEQAAADLLKALGGEEFAAPEPEPAQAKKEQPKKAGAAAEEAPKEEAKAKAEAEAEAPKEEAKSEAEAPKEEAKSGPEAAPKQ